MSLTKLEENLNIIENLPDSPNMEADELKKEFDKAGNTIKQYINEILTAEIDKIISNVNKTFLSKVDKEEGKTLSSNDFTDDYKEKVDEAYNYIVTGQEVATNEYIDGKQVYVKIIDFGALPNNDTKTVSHGLDSNVTIYRAFGITSNGLILPSYRADTSFAIEFYLSSGGIVITTHSNRSGYTARITLYYTKN